MKLYTAKFHGRTKDAIGIFHNIETEVRAETEEAARLALYERFEHISGLRLTDAEADTRRRENLGKPTRNYPGDVAMHDIQMRYKW